MFSIYCYIYSKCVCMFCKVMDIFVFYCVIKENIRQLYYFLFYFTVIQKCCYVII